MRVGLLVDSACDLPYSFIQENNIYILPLTFHIDGESFVDDRNPEKTRQFFDSGLLDKGHEVETEAFNTQQIYELLMNEVVTQYDFAFLETISAARSQVYENAWQAMHRVMADYRPKREAAGRPGSFSMRVVDSRTFFGGQGLLAAHTIHLIKRGMPKNELRSQVTEFSKNIYGCVIPRDLYYVRQRARLRGDNTISGVAAFLSKALNITPLIWGPGTGEQGMPVAKTRTFEAAADQMFAYAKVRVQKGLLSPYIVLTHGFPEAELQAMPGYQALKATCADHCVELLTTEGGVSSRTYTGPGSMGLALAAEPHEFGIA